MNQEDRYNHIEEMNHLIKNTNYIEMNQNPENTNDGIMNQSTKYN